MNNKVLLLITSAALYLSFQNTYAMRTSSENEIHLHYQAKCYTIFNNDVKKLSRYKKELEKNNFTQQELIQKQTSLRNQLAQCQQDLFATGDRLLDTIKEKHNINPCVWNVLITTVIDAHAYSVQNEKLPLPNTYHDNDVPQNIRELMIERLKFNNINPARLSIYNTECESFPHILYNYRKVPHIYENPNSSANTEPIRIHIDAKRFSQLPQSHQTVLVVHAIESMTQNAKFLPSAITLMELLLTIKERTITSSPEFIALEKLCNDTLPICLPCLQNSDIASCMLEFYLDYHYENFTIEHYKFLSTINRHWNIINLIQAYLNPPSDMELVSLSSSK